MASSYTGSPTQKYSPSAPPAPDRDQPRVAYPYQPHAPPTNPSLPYAQIPPTQSTSSSTSTGYGSGSTPPPQGYEYYPYHQQPQQQNVYSLFPPGTHPDVIRSFQMVDRNQNGYIEERELQEALTWNYQKFSLRTLRLLIFLFRSSNESSCRIGPKEFAGVWSCLGQWRAIFERFDRDRSGKIDVVELRDALYSLGYALPPPVLQVLISKYDDGSGRKGELSFDSFVECGMIVKGLTEKFKEKDPRYTGSATLSYDTFMSMIIPFIVSD
ncbi:probable calcium-binding protein CML48 [Sesamum indicum]|uniref:Probable calcium-binding protein CML48 n=1 Tax=Sesamum indicum TaxID=4182 RepID=A0A6I9TSX8_SESIN|nr:probable calcium-binding protein CML48 [Sesamum indicum]